MKHILRLSKQVSEQPVLRLVRGDAETTSILMDLPRYADGVDLSPLMWWAKIVTADKQVDRILLGTADDSSGGVLRLEWTLDYLAAVAVGATLFEVEGMGDGGKVWQSGIYRIDVVADLDGEPQVDPRVVSELQELLTQISEDIPTIYSARDAANAAADRANSAADDADEAAERLAVDLSGIRADVDDLDERVTEIEQHGGSSGGVVSVNGRSGIVVLDAADVGALPDDTPIPAPYDDTAIKAEIATKQDVIHDLASIREGAAAGATALQSESDPTVPNWAKQPSKPSYTAAEVGALPADTLIPDPYDDTDIRAEVAGKQDTIYDLDAIRAGAAAGASALQEVPDTYRTAAAQDVIDDELKDDLAEKLTAPENPVVGKILKVLSTNEDGTFVCEWGDVPAGGVTDVHINDTTIVADGIAKIPKAGVKIRGVIATYYGTSTGIEFLDPGWAAGPFPQLVAGKPISFMHKGLETTGGRYPLLGSNADECIKLSLCDGIAPAWTAEQQKAAQERMGIVTLTQEEYELLETKGESTIYMIVG